ncbi:GGDEF domain-containing protein [Kushneria marisflavi]|nr:GGDEF domain-containing protein [Kushneria marisflavi]RKD84496.1 diguanylate cyclase (GGDEF)-like protein [Kushneria marisflavi]
MQDDATELDQALEGGGQLDRVSIPPELSRAFADATLTVRRRALSKSVVIGLGFYEAFALGDAFAVPDRLELALTFRFAIILPLGLMVVCWLRRTRCALILQQVVACGFHLVVVALLALLVVLSDSVNALGFVFASYALLMFMVISMALPLSLVAVLATFVVLIQAVAIAHGPLMYPALELHNLMIAIVIIGPATFANRALENDRRRHFLLMERERYRQRLLAEQRDMLARLAALDPLTELANRRGFHAGIAGDLDRLAPGSLVAMAMIDIDHFKTYNDHYGHGAGDEALRRVARALREAARPIGRVGRMGGEEFAVFIPGITGHELVLYAERLRASVQRQALVHHHSATASVMTISVGVALGCPETSDIEALFETADAALYRAKAAGRNRVSIEDLTRPDMGACRERPDTG